MLKHASRNAHKLIVDKMFPTCALSSYRHGSKIRIPVWHLWVCLWVGHIRGSWSRGWSVHLSEAKWCQCKETPPVDHSHNNNNNNNNNNKSKGNSSNLTCWFAKKTKHLKKLIMSRWVVLMLQAHWRKNNRCRCWVGNLEQICVVPPGDFHLPG